MGDMSSSQGLEMMSASTSMKTRPAVSMKRNPINAQPFLGGMKIWSQIVVIPGQGQVQMQQPMTVVPATTVAQPGNIIVTQQGEGPGV